MGRFCSLGQTAKQIWHAQALSGNYVIQSPKLNEDKKKSSPKIKCFFLEIRGRPKKEKKVFGAN